MRYICRLLAICTLLISGCSNGNGVVVPGFKRPARPLGIEAQEIAAPDGNHGGWKVVIPNGLALTTPAVAHGMVFIGGGFASRAFYAFDADNGEYLWHYDADDNGPTTAVVAGNHVVFSTESCELEVLSPLGECIWKKHLGDPLLSMPAVSRGAIYAAYPSALRTYYLGCFDLKNGDELWKQPIPAEVITGPVVAEDRVFVTTHDGTLTCLDSLTGRIHWSTSSSVSSAPTVFNGVCYFARLDVRFSEGRTLLNERIAMRGVDGFAPIRDLSAAVRELDIPAGERPSNQSLVESVVLETARQAAIGWTQPGSSHAGTAPAGAFGFWSYQGAAPVIWEEKLYAAMGDKLICIDVHSQEVCWEKDFGKSVVVSPPALTNGKIFVGTGQRHIVCLSAMSGDVLWTAEVDDPVSLQPVVARGRVYAATDAGTLVSVATGDKGDDGWLTWGANPAHSAVVPPTAR